MGTFLKDGNRNTRAKKVANGEKEVVATNAGSDGLPIVILSTSDLSATSGAAAVVTGVAMAMEGPDFRSPFHSFEFKCEVPPGQELIRELRKEFTMVKNWSSRKLDCFKKALAKKGVELGSSQRR